MKNLQAALKTLRQSAVLLTLAIVLTGLMPGALSASLASRPHSVAPIRIAGDGQETHGNHGHGHRTLVLTRLPA